MVLRRRRGHRPRPLRLRREREPDRLRHRRHRLLRVRVGAPVDRRRSPSGSRTSGSSGTSTRSARTRDAVPDLLGWGRGGPEAASAGRLRRLARRRAPRLEPPSGRPLRGPAGPPDPAAAASRAPPACGRRTGAPSADGVAAEARPAAAERRLAHPPGGPTWGKGATCWSSSSSSASSFALGRPACGRRRPLARGGPAPARAPRRVHRVPGAPSGCSGRRSTASRSTSPDRRTTCGCGRTCSSAAWGTRRPMCASSPAGRRRARRSESHGGEPPLGVGRPRRRLPPGRPRIPPPRRPRDAAPGPRRGRARREGRGLPARRRLPWNPKEGGSPRRSPTTSSAPRWMKIHSAGATVCMVLDCCHCGTMLRGGDGGGVRLRELAPDLLGIPAAPATRGGGEDADGSPGDGGLPHGVAAVYAAQSYHRAPEMALPAAARGRCPTGSSRISSPDRWRGSGRCVASTSSTASSSPPTGRFRTTGPPPSWRATSGWASTGATAAPRDGARGARERRGGQGRLDAGLLAGIGPGAVFEVLRPAGAEPIGAVEVTAPRPSARWRSGWSGTGGPSPR